MLNVQDAPTVRTTNDGDTEAIGHEGTRAESWMRDEVHAESNGRRGARLDTRNAQEMRAPRVRGAQRRRALARVLCVVVALCAGERGGGRGGAPRFLRRPGG